MRKSPKKGRRVIFRPYITLRSGKRLYAYEYGHKAFRFEVDN